jgi:hypothetical protein
MTPARGSAPRIARLDADSTRGAHMRSILGGRLAVYAIAIGVVGTVLLGAWMREPLVMVAGPLVMVTLVVVVCFVVADRLAEQEFFRSFARARGFTYALRMELLPLTPLLGAGDRRECRHWMQGPLGEGLPACGLGQYFFKVRHGSGDSKSWTTHDFTICVADLEPGIVMYPGVFLTRRRDLVERLGGGRWLDTGTRRKVDLESEALHERCELWVERSQDDLRLLQLFSPSFVSWLAEHPLHPCFEYRAGTLVVYLERRLEDAGHLGWMLDATAEIARRLQREVVQAAGTRVPG